MQWMKAEKAEQSEWFKMKSGKKASRTGSAVLPKLQRANLAGFW
jgi:hypothetical protein